MRVLCIDGVNKGVRGFSYNPSFDLKKEFQADQEHEIYEGEMYTVIHEELVCGETYYLLAEKPADTVYKAKRFIPLTDSVEIIAEHEHEAVIYQR